ncbi:hypothetical protein [Sulfitobacter sp. JB4-11]|uniref:hypothetical protein n=1 Tax=Sulfitobacter rhodophyticola TaxID=3238304 RepID=UPI003519A9FC
MERPEYLIQGEEARLFPVLSTTSKEGRTASIVLACLTKIEEFSVELFSSIGKKVGKRSEIGCFTEVVFKCRKDAPQDRPDGLIVVKSGATEWKALVEAKIGGEVLKEEQIEKYRSIAKEHGIDCIITISNQFATSPDQHPLEAVSKSRSKIPVYHWSWMYMLTVAELLISNKNVADADQRVLLYELCRFLTHDSAGVKGFDRMPKEWVDLNKLVSAGGKIPAKSSEADVVVNAWHQETRDLSLILSRQTDTSVGQKLPKNHQNNRLDRHKDELAVLRETNCLSVKLTIPAAASPLHITADLSRKTLEVGMAIRAPDDRKTSKARLNWLLRQVKSEETEDMFVRCKWPGRSETTQFALQEVVEDPSICEIDKGGLQVNGFELILAKGLGAKFTQRLNFINELERLVPWYYAEYGQNLSEWRKPAPRIERVRDEIKEIDLTGMAEDLEP